MVEKRWLHSMHCRRRRIDAAPLPVRVSRTLVSVDEHFGHRIEIASLRGSGLTKIEEVLQDAQAILSSQGLRMKLDSPDRQVTMLNGHDFPLLGLRCDLQAFRQGGTVQYERVVTSGCKILGHSLEKAFSLVLDGRGLAVHQTIRANHLASEMLPYALVAQANTEDWLFSRKGIDNGQTATCLIRGAWPRGNNQRIGSQIDGFLRREGIVAANFLLHSELAEVLDQVIGEGIEVIYDQQLHSARF